MLKTNFSKNTGRKKIKRIFKLVDGERGGNFWVFIIQTAKAYNCDGPSTSQSTSSHQFGFLFPTNSPSCTALPAEAKIHLPTPVVVLVVVGVQFLYALPRPAVGMRMLPGVT